MVKCKYDGIGNRNRRKKTNTTGRFTGSGSKSNSHDGKVGYSFFSCRVRQSEKQRNKNELGIVDEAISNLLQS